MSEHVSWMSTDDVEGELDVEDAFGEHDISYWVREGNRLVPATPAQIAAIEEHEKLLRLAWQRSDRALHPLHVRRMWHSGLYVTVIRWLSLPFARLRHTAPAATPIEAQSYSSPLAAHHDTRERPL